MRVMPADTRLWHPFADMHAVRGAEIVIDRGEGAYVWDADGRRYLDGTASLWNVNVGHGRRRSSTPPPRRCARSRATRRSARSPTRPRCGSPSGWPSSPRSTTRGSSSARAAATRSTPPASSPAATSSRPGSPSASTSSAAPRATTAPTGSGRASAASPPTAVDMGPLDENASLVPHDSLEALEAEIERVGADRVAAVFVEPVMGAGGVHQPPPGYVEGVAELCARTGVLFIVDAVINGFGRLGTWFAADRFGVRPDMICFAKGITSGYLPLGGVVISGRDRRAVLGARRHDVPPRPDLQRAPDLLRGGDGEHGHHAPREPAPARPRARGRDRTALCGARGPRARRRGPRGDRRARRRRVRARGARRPPRPARSARSRRPAPAASSSARSATAWRCRRRSSSRARRSTTRPPSSASRSRRSRATCPRTAATKRVTPARPGTVASPRSVRRRARTSSDTTFPNGSSLSQNAMPPGPAAPLVDPGAGVMSGGRPSTRAYQSRARSMSRVRIPKVALRTSSTRHA